MALRVMVVGSGGREHALAWKLAQSPLVGEILTAPGNPGTATIGENLTLPVVDLDDLVAAARERAVDLVVVGPEDPLARGLADRLRAAGIAVFGHSAAATRIESSKAFAKELMAVAGIPTAAAIAVTTIDEALAALDGFAYPVVIKADGLAGGKGVVVAANRGEAEEMLGAFLVDHALGAAASAVLLEEYLTGIEVSVLALVDGETVVPLLPACDHKAVFDGNEGPNTGGMGAYAPTPHVDEALLAEITHTILQPAASALARRGTPLQGVLYAGLMLTEQGPRVLEFNARFGDPEAEAILPLLESDLAPLLLAVAQGRLAEAEPPRWRSGAAVCVVLAAGGYPGNYETGQEIHGLDDVPEGVIVFQAGTKRDADGVLRTQGGRVLDVVGVGETLVAARQAAYDGVDRIAFTHMHARRDIGEFGLGEWTAPVSPPR